MAPSNMVFHKDEKVLCFHQELLYEASILDVQLEDPKDKKGPYKYKVHYRGWKKTWDGWVPQDRLRKWNEENHELAKTLKKEMDALNQQRSKTSTSSKKRGDVSARDSEERNVAGRKRGRDYDTEKEDTFQSKPAVRIIMPDALKSILVDDWENITKNLQLVQVPAKEHTVSRVLTDYYENERVNRGDNTAAANILEEVVAGLTEYFNKSLGRLLLYRFERGQYEDILARVNKSGDELEGKTLAEIYGCEHLLRLFVSLPELIAQTNMDQQSATRLREELHGLTTWLSKDKNIKKYLATPYENQGAEYQERMFHSYWPMTLQDILASPTPDEEALADPHSSNATLAARHSMSDSSLSKVEVEDSSRPKAAAKGRKDRLPIKIKVSTKKAPPKSGKTTILETRGQTIKGTKKETKAPCGEVGKTSVPRITLTYKNNVPESTVDSGGHAKADPVKDSKRGSFHDRDPVVARTLSQRTIDKELNWADVSPENIQSPPIQARSKGGRRRSERYVS